MKTFAIVVALLATTGIAAPVENQEHAQQGQQNQAAQKAQQGAAAAAGSGSGSGNIFSDIFDTAACIVSSFIGGGNPNCHHQSTASSSSSGHASSGNYHYTFDTNSDGSLSIVIISNSGHKCNYTVQPNGQSLPDVISGLANRCV